METRRIPALAREGFAVFREAFARHGADSENWLFLVKLGLQRDDAEAEEGEREHLWFQVEDVQGDRIRGVLLNQPFGVGGLNEGARSEYDAALLSDWRVSSRSGGDCEPHQAGDLRRAIAAS